MTSVCARFTTSAERLQGLKQDCQLILYPNGYILSSLVRIGDLAVKPLYWLFGSKKDLLAMPEDVQDVFGYALHQAQQGNKHTQAVPLKGFSGAGVLEVVEDYDGDTYRAVYTFKFGNAVYALHCFQKKSTSGIKTAQHDIDLIKSRLKAAEEHAKGTKND